MTDEITTLREQIAALTTDKEHAYTLLERMTQDKDCAWQNVHILERARQQQDTKIAALTKERDEWKAKAKECSDWGEERRQAALDALEMAMERKEQLAAAQATNERLREALEQVAEEKARGYHEIRSIALDVLALPNDTTALDARLKEERERMIALYSPDDTAQDWIDKIRSMT